MMWTHSTKLIKTIGRIKTFILKNDSKMSFDKKINNC